jgi:uncharacterized protein YacL
MLGFSRGRTYVVDFAALADGRIVGLSNAGLLTGKMIVSDPERQATANPALIERAKTTLAKLQEDRNLKIQFARSSLEGDELLRVARKNKARIITIGGQLARDAGVTVTDLNVLFEALRPVYLPGAHITIKIVKKGKEQDEGIAYLEGGVKVVVDNAANLIGKEVEVVIQGALDTAVGRVVFGRPKYTEVR